MFKKPLSNLKSFSPLRSSDRRKFQNEAYEAYPCLKEKFSQLAAEQTTVTATAQQQQQTVSDINNNNQQIQDNNNSVTTPQHHNTHASIPHLMPDDLCSAKFISSSGDSGIVYMSGKQACWISLEKLPPIPTVYTLWKHPNMIPKLYTWAPVVDKLKDGADLMIPGLVLGPEGVLPNLETDDLVAITIKGYNIPLAIGVMAVPTKEIKPRSGMKGKAVHIIHVYEDYLWAMGDKSAPPDITEISDDNDSEEEEEIEEEQEEKESSVNNDINQATAATNEDNSELAAAHKQLSTEEIDEWLRKSLCMALVYKIKPENASIVFPISASSLYSAYIMPCRPLVTGTDVDIKKSSWKKLQKFLKTTEKAGVLKTKEQRGETIITSVTWSHPSLQNVEKYKTIEPLSQNKSSAAAAASSQQQQPTTKKEEEDKPSQAQAEVQELFKPVGAGLIKFFQEAGHDKEDVYYTIPQVKQVIADYIKIHDLVDPQNQRMINIDPILCDAILTKQEYNSIHTLGREQILHRVCQKMQPFHTIRLPGHNQKEPVLRKGQPKSVEITQEIRQGRKTVTKITGVEGFGLDVDEVCKELTRLCASSATYNPIHGVSPKNPLFEIMVQGPQIRSVTELMLGKGVPKRFIDTIDKTAKKGGKGKK